ncbi:MAG: hypothetical protein AB2A00_15795 [Myxococcota bacterium]
MRAVLDGGTWTLMGTRTWFPEGTETQGLVDSVLGAQPGFSDEEHGDDTLSPTSAARGVAEVPSWGRRARSTPGPQTRSCRRRASALDLGAFEARAVTPVEPAVVGGVGDGTIRTGATTQRTRSSCDCQEATATEMHAVLLLGTAFVLAWRRRRGMR